MPKRHEGPHDAAQNRLYHGYRHNAKVRGIAFEIDRDVFVILVALPCFICGQPPSNVCRSGRHVFLYTGLDRQENDRGYIVENVIPCCTRCNWAKGAGTLEEFHAWLYRTYHHVFGSERHKWAKKRDTLSPRRAGRR